MNRKKIIISIVFSLVIVVGAYFAWRNLLPLFSKSSQNAPITVNAENKTQAQAISINGLPVSEALATRRPLGVVIENLPDARPQSGLSKANIVYEALAEGGITRFLALFQSVDATNIGPVRSAREYFAELANPWEALFVHVGGSAKALSNLAAGTYATLIDLNQFYHADYFERVKDRAAPHNVYTSTEKLSKFLATQNPTTNVRRSLFSFKSEDPIVKNINKNASVKSITVVPAYTITIDFSTPSYLVSYTYDGEKNEYQRSIAGKADIDAEGKIPIVTKTVIAQIVDVVPVPNDPQAKVTVRLTGQGRAVVFMDGQAVEGLWKKTGSRIIYTDPSGKELPINPGPVWVELVPRAKEASFKWEGAVVNPDGSIKIGNPFAN